MTPYRVELAPAAVGAFQKLSPQLQGRIKDALLKLAAQVRRGGPMGGKAVKTIRGARDSFHRLRVGDFRVMYDVVDADRVVLVLGIVQRGDLERWIRNR